MLASIAIETTRERMSYRTVIAPSQPDRRLETSDVYCRERIEETSDG